MRKTRRFDYSSGSREVFLRSKRAERDPRTLREWYESYQRGVRVPHHIEKTLRQRGWIGA